MTQFMKRCSIFFISFSCLLFSTQSFAGIVARVIRAGSAKIGASFDYPAELRPGTAEVRKPVQLTLKEYSKSGPGVRASWGAADAFSNLATLPAGTGLEEFRVIVHGLELKQLQPGLASMSFDDFVGDFLSPSVPRGVEFTRFYPYFFHKKTVVSASVVSHLNTATFGDSGLILKVPRENLLACSTVDMHTPTDRDFYSGRERIGGSAGGKVSGCAGGSCASSNSSSAPTLIQMLTELSDPHGAMGVASMKALYGRHPLVALTDFMPKSKIDSKGTPFKKKVPTAEEVEEAAFMKALIGVMGASVAETAEDGVATQSWYNEVALVPVSPLGTAVEIQGIFLRAKSDEASLAALMTKPEVKILMELAERLNLPVLHIFDGNYYETDVGE